MFTLFGVVGILFVSVVVFSAASKSVDRLSGGIEGEYKGSFIVGISSALIALLSGAISAQLGFTPQEAIPNIFFAYLSLLALIVCLENLLRKE